MKLFYTLIYWLAPFYVTAQLPPIGQWRDHLPYSSTICVENTTERVFCATPYSLFSYDPATGDIARLSRTNGLSETGISTIKYDPATQTLVVAYTNSNLDLIHGTQIINISDIKRKNINGDKSIYHIYFNNARAYCCTGFGIVVIDLVKKQIADTYYPGSNGTVKVTGLAADNTFFYAATTEGLKKAAITNPNLSDYTQWQPITAPGLSNNSCRSILYHNNNLYLLKQDSILIQQNNAWLPWYTDQYHIENIRSSNEQILLSETLLNADGRVLVLKSDGTLQQVIQSPGKIKKPQAAIRRDGLYYIADSYGGMQKVSGNTIETIAPNAPFEKADGEMMVHAGALYICAGSVNDAWQYTFNPNGFYTFKEEQWTSTNRFFSPIPDSIYDLITTTADSKTGNLYFGSYGGGLLQLTPPGQLNLFKQNSALQPTIGDPGSYRVAGLATDAGGNLWISNYGAPAPLVVKKADQTWQTFTPPFLLTENALAQVTIDDLDQLWIVSPKGNGLICFNHGSSIANTADDRWRLLRTGAGNGNLPDNEVYCTVKDKDGLIWAGTAHGIAVITCPGEIFAASCEATLPIVRQGSFNSFLFSSEAIKAIAVDGANRKWVGTANGVWLISADGEKELAHFTEDNSPLLSNDIKRIAIDPLSGEVFFATFKGICSYRGTATEGGETNSNVLVFPNPVPPGYTGTIAIKGLANNAIVKITAPDGRLVYQTRAQGGQATWNGRNYKGILVSSGAYLVLVANNSNAEKTIAKIFITR